MKHLTILVPEGENNLSSIVGTFKIFSRANVFRKSQGLSPVFEVQLVGISSEINLYEGIFAVRPHVLLSQMVKTDLIIIPSLNHNYKQALEINKPIIDWISEQYLKGAEIASICTGAFLLAATGLLDERSCSTHWAAAQAFKGMFPKVKVLDDKIMTDAHGIYTNGGAFSFLNLLMYLVEKYYDRDTAIYCSKVFQIDLDRHSQSPFSMFIGQKDHGDELIQKAQALIETQVHEKTNVEHLAAVLAISRRSFDRRFIKATGNTPLEYQQRVKVEAAKRAFEISPKSINEVMYDVGYSDLKAFRDVFRKITGLSPLAYKSKYNKVQS